MSLSLLVSFLVLPRLSAQDLRKSPYFIDGVHCEGLSEVLRDEKTRIFPIELREVKQKIAERNLCEGVFAKASISKFQWITPEDLENLSLALKNSQKFASVSIRIEKSELQNHIHLIGTFVLFEPRNYAKVYLNHALDAGGGDGDRRTTRMGAELGFNKRGDVNPTPVLVSVDYRSSVAASPLGSVRDNSIASSKRLTPNEELALSQKEESLLAARLQFTNLTGGFTNVGFVTSKLSGDDHATLNPLVEFGTVALLNSILQADTRFSLKLVNYSHASGETTRKDSKNKNSRSMAFVGFSQAIEDEKGYFKLKYYRSITPEVHSDAWIDGFWKFREAAGFDHGISLTGLYWIDSVSPEFRYGLPSRSEVRYGYTIKRDLGASALPSLISLTVGQAFYQSNGDSDNPYRRDQIFGEINYNTRFETIETSLGFVYGSRRLY